MTATLPPIDDAHPLILGSASPRRKEILAQVRVPFVVRAASADEDVRPGEAPHAYLARVARAKLDAVRALGASGPCILVADTTVVCDGILGKPADFDEALAMIRRLAGRAHEVHTRFAIGACDASPPLHEETVTTRVVFRAIDDAEARAYAASGEGMDKAGGYAVQGLASAFCERIEGSYTNVVGLPACQVVTALRKLGALA